MGNLYSFKLGDSIAEEEAEEEGGRKEAEDGRRRAPKNFLSKDIREIQLCSLLWVFV